MKFHTAPWTWMFSFEQFRQWKMEFQQFRQWKMDFMTGLYSSMKITDNWAIDGQMHQD
jgi:hypothetical protein